MVLHGIHAHHTFLTSPITPSYLWKVVFPNPYIGVIRPQAILSTKWSPSILWSSAFMDNVGDNHVGEVEGRIKKIEM